MREGILKRPHLTEKAVAMKEKANQVTFEVARDANKIEIRRAIEQLFDVGVRKVATINVRGKKKRMGRYQGRRSAWKKAMITLKPGDKIEYFEGA